MKLELKDFDSVNFHDAKLLGAEERLEYVRLEMDAAIIYLPVKKYDCTAWLIRSCSLECFGVTGSEKKEWADTRPKQWHDLHLTIPVTNPALPIHEISSNEQLRIRADKVKLWPFLGMDNSPSPQPSPAGRGSNARRAGANSALTVAR